MRWEWLFYIGFIFIYSSHFNAKVFLSSFQELFEENDINEWMNEWMKITDEWMNEWMNENNG